RDVGTLREVQRGRRWKVVEPAVPGGQVTRGRRPNCRHGDNERLDLRVEIWTSLRREVEATSQEDRLVERQRPEAIGTSVENADRVERLVFTTWCDRVAADEVAGHVGDDVGAAGLVVDVDLAARAELDGDRVGLRAARRKVQVRGGWTGDAGRPDRHEASRCRAGLRDVQHNRRNATGRHAAAAGPLEVEGALWPELRLRRAEPATRVEEAGRRNRFEATG